jgi:hypothetical protein
MVSATSLLKKNQGTANIDAAMATDIPDDRHVSCTDLSSIQGGFHQKKYSTSLKTI